MLITREQFLHFVNRYKHCIEERDNFHKALSPWFENPVVNYMERGIDGLAELLVVVAECDNEDDIFNWWVSECDEDNHIITVKNVETGENIAYDVATAEGLYEYLYAMYHHGG